MMKLSKIATSNLRSPRNDNKKSYSNCQLSTVNCKLLCVSGKMAAGKNYICSQFEKDGWTSLDCDILVHNAIDIAKDKILDTFTPHAEKLNIKLQRESDGSIDRRALGQLLFSMPSLLEVQENIVYTIITKQIDDYITLHPDENIIINATVLFKTPVLMQKCEKIIFVTAPFFTRLKRAKKRDNLPYKQIFQRFWAQRNLYRKYKATKIPIEILNNK